MDRRLQLDPTAAEMMARLVRQGILIVAVLAVAATVRPQSIMILGGYESDHASFGIAGGGAPHTLFADGLQGWTAGVVAPVEGGLAFVGRITGIYGQSYDTSPVVGDGRLRPHLYTYERVVRFMHDATRRITPFAEGVLGMTAGQVGVQGHEGGTAAGAVVFAALGESQRREVSVPGSMFTCRGASALKRWRVMSGAPCSTTG